MPDLTGEAIVQDVNVVGPSGYIANVTEDNRLAVVQKPPAPPPLSTPVIITDSDSVSGTKDHEYVITSGKTLHLSRFMGGSESGNSGSKLSLLYDDGQSKEILAIGFANGSNFMYDLSQDILGDGTKKIIIRRENLDYGQKEIFTRFEGYESD